MSTLSSEPYSLVAGTLLQASLEAHNSYGWGDPSPFNSDPAGLTVKTRPASLVLTPGLSDDTSIVFSWATLSTLEGGNSPLLSYEVQSDGGVPSNGFASLAGPDPVYTTPSYTQSAGVNSGSLYTFRVRATNLFGSGEFASISIKASTLPDTVSILASSYVGTSIHFHWTTPPLRGGTLIGFNAAILDDVD